MGLGMVSSPILVAAFPSARRAITPVGVRVGLGCGLGYTAWAAWFRRQILASTSLIAVTLLLCDAWFDVITSIGRRDQWLTVLTALGGELPMAIFFFWLYRRIVLTTLATRSEE